VTSPLNFIKSDAEILRQHHILTDYQRRLSEGDIYVTPSEKKLIKQAYYVSTSAVRPGTEELVPRMFRMSAFMATNTPISFGMLMSPPTMFYTILWQSVNQSYMATLNYQNKNASSVFTN